VVKKTAIIVFLLSLGLTYSNHNILAQTPQAATESGSKAEALETLKRLINEIKEKKKIKVYAGTIKGILGKSISLETRNGSKTMEVNDQTKIILDSPTKEPRLENILAGQFAIALGEIGESKIMNPKTLQIFSASQTPSRKKAFFGIVKSIDSSGMTIADQKTGSEMKVKIDTLTKIKTKTTEITINDIKIGWKTALAGIATPSGEVLARKILVETKDFSHFLKFTEIQATTSATRSATTSAAN